MVVLIDTVSSSQVRPRHPEKVNRPDAKSPAKPDWIRVRAPMSRGYANTRNIVKENGLVTVCEEAGCPNITLLRGVGPLKECAAGSVW